MSKQLLPITEREITEQVEKGLIRVVCGAILSDKDWASSEEERRRTVLRCTSQDIIDESDYFIIMAHENGMQIVPYEKAEGGAIQVHQLKVDYFAKIGDGKNVLS